MLNSQTPARLDRREDGALLVHSIFDTIQGEGPFRGHAACFVRLAGCNLQCPWCDTEYTAGATLFTARDLLYQLDFRNAATLIVITGGEPFRQNVGPFIHLALRAAYKVQIETNGTLFLPEFSVPYDDPNLTIVCSPKTHKIHPRLAMHVDAFKYVLDAENVAEDGLPVSALGHPLPEGAVVARPPVSFAGDIFIQPLDTKDAAVNARHVRACVQSVLTHRRYILGFQMHKEIGLP